MTEHSWRVVPPPPIHIIIPPKYESFDDIIRDQIDFLPVKVVQNIDENEVELIQDASSKTKTFAV